MEQRISNPHAATVEQSRGVVDVAHVSAVEDALRRSEAFARSVLDSSPDFLAVLDLDGRVLSLGRVARKLLGPQIADHVVGRFWAEGCPTNYRDVVRASVVSAAEGVGYRFSGPCPDRAGGNVWWDVSVDPIQEGEGQITHLLAIGRDVTEQKCLREDAEEAHAHLSLVLDSTADCVIVLDCDWRITYVNERARSLISDLRPARIGDMMWDLNPENVGGLFDLRFREAIAT